MVRTQAAITADRTRDRNSTCVNRSCGRHLTEDLPAAPTTVDTTLLRATADPAERRATEAADAPRAAAGTSAEVEVVDTPVEAVVVTPAAVAEATPVGADGARTFSQVLDDFKKL